MTLYITRYNAVFRVDGKIVQEFGVIRKGQFEFVSADEPSALIKIKVGEVFENVDPIQSALITFLLANGIERVSIYD